MERQGGNQEGRQFQNKGGKDDFKQKEALRLTPGRTQLYSKFKDDVGGETFLSKKM